MDRPPALEPVCAYSKEYYTSFFFNGKHYFLVVLETRLCGRTIKKEEQAAVPTLTTRTMYIFS